MKVRTSRTSLVDVELLYPYSNSGGYGLAIVYYISSLGSPMPITLIYWNMVLRIQEIKASKRCTKIKIGNHVVGPADRSKKNKSMLEVSCSNHLFTQWPEQATQVAQ